MAYLMLGLAKSVVEGVLTNAQAAIQEEAKLRQNAKRNMVFITLEVEMIYSFLQVATEERIKNSLVRTWVRQVRELAYDLEDCMEFVVHLDNKSAWYFRLLPSWIAPPPLLDEAVREIEELRARAEELSKCYLRYSHIMDADPKLFKLQQHATSSDASGVVAVSMLMKARDASERHPRLRDLAKLITKEGDQELQVISVWETVDGDLGTTAIIRQVYYDPSFVTYFTSRAWVKIMQPFNPRDFIRSLMAQFYATSCKDSNMVGTHVLTKMDATHKDLVKEFEQLIKEKRYLIVLEGFSNMLEWDTIRTFLPDMKNGSWIIVSTQRFEIASLCIGHSYQLTELKQFSPEHSVCALFKQGSQGDGYRGDKPRTKEAASDWMTKNPLVGRESEFNDLRNHIAAARFSDGGVVSVWGMAGVGKTALVRHSYYYMLAKSNQFNKYIWVDVSHPFSISEFCRSILLDIHSGKDPIEECRQFLSQYRFLLVIDDLQSNEDLDIIHTALSLKSSGSVIIFVTTEACFTYQSTSLRVKPLLEADAAIDLFKTEVQRINPSSLLLLVNHRIVEVEELVLKCGGLPKVIAAIADVLATQMVTLMDTIYSLNWGFMLHLETNPVYDNLRGLFDWISSFFRTCPDSLKPCIIYLSIFPRRHTIRRRRLVRRWIAEDYSRDSHEQIAENNGESYFANLLDVNIIQQPQGEVATAKLGGTRMVFCQVNSFFLHYIVSRRIEENFVFELWGNCPPTTQRTGRHLVIQKSWDRDRTVFKSNDFSRLRSLTVFGEWKSFFVSEQMKFLRVLDLEDAAGVRDDDLEKMAKCLNRLKFLSLRGQREIYHLPSSVGHLRQLQTLDIRHTSIAALPKSITKLRKLQYIRAGNTTNSDPASSSSGVCRFHRHMVGVEVPRGVGELTGLHTLGVVDVAASGGKAILEEFKKLTHLRKLGVSGISRKNSKEFISAISGHVHLESLSVHFDKDNRGCLDDISTPWENLQSLKLYGLGDMLPQWRNQLSTLRKLALEMDTLKKNDMDLLAQLPALCILRLQVKQQLQDGKLHFHAELYECELVTFQKVKILEIACSSSEVHVTFGSKSMKNLELLKIDYSSGTSYQLAGLNNLSELKQVLLKGTNDEEFRTQFASHLANHPNRPVVKLEELPRSS